MIDTGAAKNYIKNISHLKGIKPVERPFIVQSLHGSNQIELKCIINLFNQNTPFFILPQLSKFDGIIGCDFLHKIGAQLDLKKGIISYDGRDEKLFYLFCRNVNHISIDNNSVPPDVRKQFDLILGNRLTVFADPNESLPYNTKVVATIKTTDNEPVYSKAYPYPMAAVKFVNQEVSDLLNTGIIRPSRSPYNNPVWVVDKKGLNEDGSRKMRLVIDFRKLNAKTVSDKYPIPDTTVILSNLGQSSFFSTLDLKSGFHQIRLCERDREKTAFSVNNGKFEFCRLPFGLKNAPSIFQRAIDDVLRDEIGRCCHVYIDDVIVFSKTKEQHISDIDRILLKLFDANMRVSQEKSKFFKREVEFLGFVVSERGIKTCPNKVSDIVEYEIPKTLRSLRSFLGLSGYYRRFIRDYAKIAKPLTKFLRGENGNVSARQSKNIAIEFDQDAIDGFKRIKNILASEDVLLLYPDYTKPFDLTTDASSHALGAVLSQNGRPITMISRTLSAKEEDFATNERELLAIVWALGKLRNYLYGCRNLNIFTDHQPLTFSISDKNPNTKMKRWMAFVEEFSPTFHYKPGKENLVADALSRQNINIIDHSGDSDSVTGHSEVSLTKAIRTVDNPVNCFRNQIFITKGTENKMVRKILFQKKFRYVITFSDRDYLFKILDEVVNPNVINGLHCELHVLAFVKDNLLKSFPSTKFIHSEKFVIDIFNENDQQEILAVEHNRAHRSLRENLQQILKDYFFPDIRKKLREMITNCRVCNESKYKRHPPRVEIGKTPIPSYAGEILHVDIYSTDKLHFLTCLDKYSKFAAVFPIKSRAIIDIKEPLIEIINFFKDTKTIVCDNEKSFNSQTIKTLLRNHFKIEIFTIPPFHSTSNGQVERFHSTLTEIARCTKLEQGINDTNELILLSTVKYNRTIHSIIKHKPIEVIHSNSLELKNEIKTRLLEGQNKSLTYHNRNKQTKSYKPGEKVYVRTNKRIGNKFRKLFVEKIIQEDRGSTVLIDDRIVHKSNLR